MDILLNGKRIEYRDITEKYENKFSKNYESVLFMNGYTKDAPTLEIELKKIKKAKNEFRLYLGDILDFNDATTNLIEKYAPDMLVLE